MSQRFRKKQVEVEAVHNAPGVEFPLAFLRDDEEVRKLPGSDSIEVRRHDCMTIAIAQLGEWLVRRPNGHLVSCAAEVFEATYEPVEETCATFDCNDKAVASAEVPEADKWARYCEDCAGVLERGGDKVKWDEPQGVVLGAGDRERLAEIANAMKGENPSFWRPDIDWLRSLTSHQPDSKQRYTLEEWRERMLSDEVVLAAAKSARPMWSAYKVSDKTRALIETGNGIEAAFKAIDSEEGGDA